jgi:glycerol-3-phosphate dehydrogenase (NAD(P)+)
MQQQETGGRMVETIRTVAVLGAGSFGTTIANLVADQGIPVSIWARENWLTCHIANHRENPKYLPGVRLSENLRAMCSLEEGLADVDAVIYAIPAQSLREIARLTRPFVPERAVLVNLAKGIEEQTGARCSEILAEELRNGRPISVLSGPNIAHEVIRNVPSKGVVSCNSYRYLPVLKRLFSTPCFKVYENPDLAGTELGGALKNVFAIMAGIGDGLGYGVNTKAAVITRGLHEMATVGAVMGGHRDTFYGLSGAGDLMATCLSEHSRNRRVGELLGRGLSLEDAERALNGRVAEGIKTTKALYEIKGRYGLTMPIVDTLYRVLYDGLPPRDGYLAIWSPGEAREVA